MIVNASLTTHDAWPRPFRFSASVARHFACVPHVHYASLCSRSIKQRIDHSSLKQIASSCFIASFLEAGKGSCQKGSTDVPVLAPHARCGGPFLPQASLLVLSMYGYMLIFIFYVLFLYFIKNLLKIGQKIVKKSKFQKRPFFKKMNGFYRKKQGFSKSVHEITPPGACLTTFFKSRFFAFFRPKIPIWCRSSGKYPNFNIFPTELHNT